MSIDNIQLPAFLQKEFFKNKLVSKISKPAHNLSNEDNVLVDFLGGNLKNIAFIVNSAENKFLNDDQLTFILNLVKACNISLDDIAVVNFAHQNAITYLMLKNQLSCNKVLSFGVTPADLDLPFAIPFFQMQNFRETDYIFCPSLNELQEDTNAKKKLWASLQKIFNINKQK